MKKMPGSTEKKLIDCIFKYREALSHKKYLSVPEREADRQSLNDLYESLSNLKQKVLDSKCYLQFGEVQKEQTARLLADETTPEQRTEMLAYVLRCLCHPVVHFHGRSSINNYPERKEMALEEVEPEFTSFLEDNKPQTLCTFKTRPISYEELEASRKKLRQFIKKETSPRSWSSLSLSEAEILSQLAADGQAKIPIEVNDSAPSNYPVAIVLKES